MAGRAGAARRAWKATTMRTGGSSELDVAALPAAALTRTPRTRSTPDAPGFFVSCQAMSQSVLLVCQTKRDYRVAASPLSFSDGPAVSFFCPLSQFFSFEHHR
jgi:hypothetical protein